MKSDRQSVRFSEHAVERWAQRSGQSPLHLSRAWSRAIYVGNSRMVHRGTSVPIYAFRVPDTTLILLVRFFGGRRRHRHRWVVVSCWHHRWWEQLVHKASQMRVRPERRMNRGRYTRV